MGLISFFKDLFSKKQLDEVTVEQEPSIKIVEETKDIEDRFIEKSEKVTAKEIKSKSKKVETKVESENTTEEVKKKPRRRKPANKKPKTEE